MYPEDLKYTAEHEWARAVTGEGDPTVQVGITDFAQDALGDIVFVSLPAVGSEMQAGQSFGEVESTKSVSEVYAPLSGTVVARNEALDGTPELVNSDPYGRGWLVEMRPADPDQLAGLLDATAYRELVEKE